MKISEPLEKHSYWLLQISDLIVFITWKVLEVENGYGNNWPKPVKDFFAKCYHIIYSIDYKQYYRTE